MPGHGSAPPARPAIPYHGLPCGNVAFLALSTTGSWALPRGVGNSCAKGLSGLAAGVAVPRCRRLPTASPGSVLEGGKGGLGAMAQWRTRLCREAEEVMVG